MSVSVHHIAHHVYGFFVEILDVPVFLYGQANLGLHVSGEAIHSAFYVATVAPNKQQVVHEEQGVMDKADALSSPLFCV